MIVTPPRDTWLEDIRRGKFKKRIRWSEIDGIETAARQIIKAQGTQNVTPELFAEANRLLESCKGFRAWRDRQDAEFERRGFVCQRQPVRHRGD